MERHTVVQSPNSKKIDIIHYMAMDPMDYLCPAKCFRSLWFALNFQSKDVEGKTLKCLSY